jgi:hypothetical protein
MSATNFSSGESKFYDPGEVEAYINEATNTIKTLQARLADATRRSEEAERSMSESQPETASLGRALLLASEVADKTLSDADARAAEIVRAAQAEASTIIAASQRDADRLIDRAKEAAAAHYRVGQERLLAAVAAFVEGANVLRGQLTEVEEDSTRWQGSVPPPSAVDRPARTDILGGIHNRAVANGTRPPAPDSGADAESDPSIRVPPLPPPPPMPSFRDQRAPGAR